MPRWTAKVTGTLNFTREITVYACNEHDAGIIAEELTMQSAGDDRIEINGINISAPLDELDITYEIGIRVKE